MFQLDKTIVQDHAREQMAHVFADIFLDEMLQAAVAGVVVSVMMSITFDFESIGSRRYLCFWDVLNVYFAIMA